MKFSALMSLASDEFIYCAYKTVLGREPDADGYSYYKNRLEIGFSRISVLDQLVRSSELDRKAVGLTFDLMLYRVLRVPLLGWLVELFCSLFRLDIHDYSFRSSRDQRIQSCCCLSDETEKKARGIVNSADFLPGKSGAKLNAEQRLTVKHTNQLGEAVLGGRLRSCTVGDAQSPGLSSIRAAFNRHLNVEDGQ